jgi:hypothetical protein
MEQGILILTHCGRVETEYLFEETVHLLHVLQSLASEDTRGLRESLANFNSKFFLHVRHSRQVV